MSYGADLRAGLLDFRIAPAPIVTAWEPVVSESVDVLAYWNGPSIAARRAALRPGIVINHGFSTLYGLGFHKTAHGEIEVVEKKPERIPYFEKSEDERRDPHEWQFLLTGCNEFIAVTGQCADPFCLDCASRRSEELRERLMPELSRMHNPKMITLTIRSGPDLEVLYRELLSSWRRMFEYSLGSRGLARLMCAARRLVNRGWVIGELDDDRARRIVVELGRFEKRIARKWRRADRPVRFRDLLSHGWRITETTQSDSGWHPHFHLCCDCYYIPQPVLRALWTICTRGSGLMVDIRKVTKDSAGLMEVSKYFAKPTLQDLPDDLKNEVRVLAYGMVKCQAFGVKYGKRYEIPPAPPKPCQYCELGNCKRHHLGKLRVVGSETLDDGARRLLVEFGGVQFHMVKRGGMLVGGEEAKAALKPFLDAFIGQWRNRTPGASGAGGGGPGPPGAPG